MPPKMRSNSIDLDVEQRMGGLDINEGANRGKPQIVRPHTSNTTRSRPAQQHHMEPMPPVPPHPGNMAPPGRDFRGPGPADDGPMGPLKRSATTPADMGEPPRPQYPGQQMWQEPPPLSPGYPGSHPSTPSRPGTATGMKPGMGVSTGAPQPTGAGEKDESRSSTDDFLDDYFNNDTSEDMPNFGAMTSDTPTNTKDESLIPFDKPKADSKPAYTAYQPPGGIAQSHVPQTNYGTTQYDNGGYQNDIPPLSPRHMDNPYGYGADEPYMGHQGGRGMAPGSPQGGGGYNNGRGGYPPQQPRGGYGPPMNGSGGNVPFYDNPPPQQDFEDMRGGPVDSNQSSAPQNPDALPHHPAPFRPGLEQAANKPPPIRQYGNTSQSNQGGPPNENGEPDSGTITFPELQRLRQTASSNPSDHATQLLLAKKLVEASVHLIDDNGRADQKTRTKNRERYVMDAYKTVKKLVNSNYAPAMFYLADCYGQGQLGLEVNPKEAFQLYQSAAKLGHAESAYRLAVCCEMGQEGGGGTRRDPMRAVQWYRRAATLGDTPAMYKMGMILLKGLLGQQRNPRESLSWLKRAAERADKDNPHALHELALLYENPGNIDSIIRDENYARELLHQAGELDYKFSQHRLGASYEYGLLGCPVDSRSSIMWYSRAAAQGEHQSELSLSGWYLTGCEGILQQSDTEAYLWARRAAIAGLAKAEYAMGYFTEVGIGVSANMDDAKRWYWKASCKFFILYIYSTHPPRTDLT